MSARSAAFRPPAPRSGGHVVGRRQNLAAEVEVDHAQRQAVGEDDGHRLRVGIGVELRRGGVVAAGDAAAHPGQVGDAGGKIGPRQRECRDVGQRPERQDARAERPRRPASDRARRTRRSPARPVRRAASCRRSGCRYRRGSAGRSPACRAPGRARPAWIGKPQPKACAAPAALLPDVFERRIAEDQRDAVDGEAGVRDDQHRRDVVEPHVGVDPHAHRRHPKRGSCAALLDRQVEGDVRRRARGRQSRRRLPP